MVADPSSIAVVSTYVSQSISDTVPVPSPTYTVFPSSKGIDLYTFRCSLLSTYKPKLNITSIIKKSIENRVILLSKQSDTSSGTATFDQPKILSFLHGNANSACSAGSSSLLYNKS